MNRGGFEMCASAQVDTRYGGRLLITELHYNPPNVPAASNANDGIRDYSKYQYIEDGTSLEFIELYNGGNAAVNLKVHDPS